MTNDGESAEACLLVLEIFSNLGSIGESLNRELGNRMPELKMVEEITVKVDFSGNRQCSTFC